MLHLPKINKQDIRTDIRLPLSKSILNRMLLIDALAGQRNKRSVELAGNDCILLNRALHEAEQNISFEDAGTPLRLFVAYAALQGNGILISGTPRLAQRPLRPLLEALESLGAMFEYSEKAYSLPLRVVKPVDKSRQSVNIDGSLSSQFISALMLIGPSFSQGLTLHCSRTGQSLPYIRMSAGLMKKAGIEAVVNGTDIHIPAGRYKPEGMGNCESDWSAAAFIYAWVAACPEAEFFLPGLLLDSLQGDAAAAAVFAALGVESKPADGGLIISGTDRTKGPFSFSMLEIPDVFPALAAACAIRRIPATFSDIASLRHKESDRLESMRVNLLQCGAELRILPDNIAELHYFEKPAQAPVFQAFADHRIAMALSVFAFAGEIRIEGYEHVKKSFPWFWDEQAKLYL